MEMLEIGKNLKQIRLERGFSTYDVEKTTGIKHQNLSRWENGQNVPSILQCISLAECYGVSLDVLLGLSDY